MKAIDELQMIGNDIQFLGFRETINLLSLSCAGTLHCFRIDDLCTDCISPTRRNFENDSKLKRIILH